MAHIGCLCLCFTSVFAQQYSSGHYRPPTFFEELRVIPAAPFDVLAKASRPCLWSRERFEALWAVVHFDSGQSPPDVQHIFYLPKPPPSSHW